MAAPREFDDEALIELFWALRERGWRLVPQQLAQARSLLAGARDADVPDAELPFLLTPLLAKSPPQQAELHARLAARLGSPDRPAPLLQGEEGPPPPSGPEPPPDVGGRVLRIALGTVLGLLAAGLLRYWMLPEPPPDAPPIPLPDIAAPLPPPLTTRETVVAPVYTVWLTVLGLAPAALLIAWWLARRLRQREGLGRDDDAGSLDRLDVGARPIAQPLFSGPNLAAVARQWRRFRRVPTAELDPERTVLATIAMGGMFTPVTATRPLAPEYLLLIEEAGRHDHVARLADNLADRLVDEGVAIRRFYQEDGVATLRTAVGGGPSFLGCAELPASARETMVLIGTGAALFDPLTAAPRRVALGELERWERRALLSTRPIGEWDDRERMLLEQGFAMATAEESGVAALGRHIARGFPAHQGLLQGMLVTDDGPPPPPPAAPYDEDIASPPG